MARTIDEIFDEIMLEKAARSDLSGLTSGSSTAIYRLWAYVVATAIHFHEKLWDLFKAEVEELAEQAAYGTVKWWHTKILEFQYGDSLSVVEFRVIYPVIDPAKQIIERCAIVEDLSIYGQPKVDIKVAKDTGGGVLGALSSSEELALESYIENIKPAGVRTNVISTDGDLLKLPIEVFFDPLVTEAVVSPAVEAAIDAYLANLEFNGAINISAMEDAIQAVSGVIDVVMGNLEIKNTGIYYTIDREEVPVGGYAVIDPAFPLSSTITYTPDV